MHAPDLFTLWFILNKYQPKVVIESGVWKGISTLLIRKTLPNCKIICLDPRNIPENGYKDNLRDWFKLIYEVVFGDENGPRLGFFISFFGIQETKKLIIEKINNV